MWEKFKGSKHLRKALYSSVLNLLMVQGQTEHGSEHFFCEGQIEKNVERN